MKDITLRGARKLKSAKWALVVLFGCILGLIGAISGASPAFAQDCTLPSGVAENPLATPSVTAAQAAAGGDSLRDFALAGRDYFNSITTPEEVGYAGCLVRNEGPWKAGDTYLVGVSLDGRVFFHAEDMSLGGRKLQPAIYGGILAALGIDLADPSTIPAQLANVAATRTFPNADGGEIPGIGGYAVGYGIHIPYILLAGVDLQEQHFAPDTVDPGDPEVSADEVVDRATLKAFVNGAIDYLLNLYQTNPAGSIGIARSILRNPPWRSGPTYLFIMEESGYTLLHAGFPDRFEFQTPTQTLRDQVTGELILPQIIEAAKGGGEEGAFVRILLRRSQRRHRQRRRAEGDLRAHGDLYGRIPRVPSANLLAHRRCGHLR